MNIKNCIRELEERKVAIANERDKLRELLSDLEQLEDNCDEAIENIDRAIDAISELV